MIRIRRIPARHLRAFASSVGTALLVFFVIVSLHTQGQRLERLVDDTRANQTEAQDRTRAAVADVEKAIRRELDAREIEHERLLERIRELLAQPQRVRIIEQGETVIIRRVETEPRRPRQKGKP